VSKREFGSQPSPLSVTSGQLPARASLELTRASDAEGLARALIANEPNSAMRVWERFAPLVRRILRRALGNAHNVEDLVQEVFLRLFLKVHQLRELKAFEAFIISIATFIARAELRRRRARSWLGLSPDASALDLRVVDPDPVGREALKRFYDLLDRFNSRDRMAYVLRYIEGMGLSEVSAALGVSLATTKRNLLRVQRRMLHYVERDPLLSDYLSSGSKRTDVV
jgi:RNA polymerase sigma-70 factor (ECF subfamily)